MSPGLIPHYDRGSQYASQAFQDSLAEHGRRAAMSRKGNGWDNAPTESWFNRVKRVKNERSLGERFASHEAMTATTFEYIEVFYNRRRLHSTLGYYSPRQFLETRSADQHSQDLVS